MTPPKLPRSQRRKAGPDVLDPTAHYVPAEPLLSGADKLWRACLTRLLADAAVHWRGQGWYGGMKDYEPEQAFDDVVRCGPMLRRVCSFAGLHPEWVTRMFIRFCEQGGNDE